MNDESQKEGTGAGSAAGFQVPLGMKNRKAKVDEMLKKHSDINELHALVCFSKMEEPEMEKLGQQLDSDDFDGAADAMREFVARSLVKHRVKEVVRKKPGGGGFTLYGPNQGKKKHPKPAGTFPTKLGAKRAELSRFPPKDPGKLMRLRKEIERMNKKRGLPTKKKEGIDLLRLTVKALVLESLFREERSGSDWDEHIAKLSKQAVSSDKKFQNLQKNIEKKTGQVLEDSLGLIAKATKKDAKIKNHGIKHSPEKGKTYLSFEAEIENVAVGPIFIYAENGVPKIEVSEHAKGALAKADPDKAKLFRAELIGVQERVLDKVEDLVKAIGARDKYLTKVEDDVDGLVADMTPLQIAILKKLLVSKYRKIA